MHVGFFCYSHIGVKLIIFTHNNFPVICSCKCIGIYNKSLIHGGGSTIFSTTDELLHFIHNNGYDKHFKSFEKHQLYRGSRSDIDGVGVLVTPGSGRQSAHTTNEYNLFLSGDPTWKDFPKRSSSNICTTSIGKAVECGSVYAVILPNNFKIGIAPSHDIWDSFTEFAKNLTINYFLSEFNENLRNILIMAGNGNVDSINTYEQLIKAMDDATTVIRNNIEMQSETYPSFNNVLQEYIFELILNNMDDPSINVHSIIQDLLDPTKNDFKASSSLGDLVSGNQEVWTDSTCLLIPVDKLKQLL